MAGETGVVQVISTNVRTGKVVFDYIVGILNEIPELGRLVVNKTSDVIYFSNNTNIEIRAASSTGLRGPSSVAVVCDEISSWSTGPNSANPDVEILRLYPPVAQFFSR